MKLSNQGQIEKLRVDLPTLQAIAARTWGKEDELKAFKAELVTLDQKITAVLAPKQEKQDFGEEVKREEPTQPVNRADAPTQSGNDKESMVAEPLSRYEYTRVATICDFGFRAAGPKF